MKKKTKKKRSPAIISLAQQKANDEETLRLLSRALPQVQEVMAQVMGQFSSQLKEAFDYHGRRIDEVVGVIREMGQESRGVLLEFAKFKQLHRVHGELAWLDGIHGRQAMAAFKEAAGLTDFAKIMKARVVELQEKRAKGNGLPEGVAMAPTYTWYCDHCEVAPEVHNSPEESKAARDAHMAKTHPTIRDEGGLLLEGHREPVEIFPEPPSDGESGEVN